jgi:hypothetical protein
VLFDRLAELPVDVERYRLEQLRHEVTSGFVRVTTMVVMEGGGHQGVGEDVTYTADDHDGFPADLPLAGQRSLAEQSQLLEGRARPAPPWPRRSGGKRGRCGSCCPRARRSTGGSSWIPSSSSSSIRSPRGTTS